MGPQERVESRHFLFYVLKDDVSCQLEKAQVAEKVKAIVAMQNVKSAEDFTALDAADQMLTVRQRWCDVTFGQWCGTATFCFWAPMCFFMAAANVLPTCETPSYLGIERSHLDNFMKLYSFWTVLTAPVLTTIVVMSACSGKVCCYTWAKRVQYPVHVVSLLLMIWGFVIYGNTTDELCYDPDRPGQEHGINPRTLLLWYLLSQIVNYAIYPAMRSYKACKKCLHHEDEIV